MVVDTSFSGLKREFSPSVSLQLLEMSPSEIAARNTFAYTLKGWLSTMMSMHVICWMTTDLCYLEHSGLLG
ncbi:hypothetical protein ACFLXT_04085 [Chloroflexota bacterium]